MRWIDELFAPSLKCERVGHKDRIQERSGYTRSSDSYYVADSVTQERHFCPRCGSVLSDWMDTHRTGLNGLTMDSDRMRILETEGAVWNG